MHQCEAPRKREELRQGQLVAVNRLVSQPHNMLSMGMGIGKTGAVLTAIRDLLDTFQVRHVLVIAPLLVAEETWPDEIETWEHTSVLDYEVLTGSPARRESRAKRLPELTIINIENVVWLVEFWGDDWPYDWVIVDESSKFKNPAKKTKPTKKAVERVVQEALASLPSDAHPDDVAIAVDKAAKRAPRYPTRFGALCTRLQYTDRFTTMTGTIAPNGLLDLWAQYYLLDRGRRLGSTYFDYRRRWFEGDYMGFKYQPRPGAFDQIMDAIRDITISMRTEDYADLPPVIYNTLSVKLPPKVMKRYREFEKTLIWQHGEDDIEAVNNGVLTGKLLQLCIAEGTEVLCRRGWVPIEDVTCEDGVWDGVEFVSTKGVKYNGKSDVVTCFGVEMTRGHEVLTDNGWKTAGEILDADAIEGLNRAEVRLPDSPPPGMAGGAPSRSAGEKVSVYDLIDCGPRNRFVVRGDDGPLIVHNCNGSIYDEEGEAKEIHALKLEVLDRVIEEANGAPVLVAYSYEFDLVKLKKRYPKAEVVGETKNLQKRWNHGEIPILLAHPASAGHGLNLQYGGCITVWYGLTWSLEYYQQLNQRLRRPGQPETVIIHHIVAEGTVDERVMEVLPEKDATQDAVVEATKWVMQQSA